MKIYKYFIEKEGKHVLYAYTNKKERAKSFELFRNMDKFIKVVDNISEDDYRYFMKTNYNQVLSNKKITTYYLDDEGYYQNSTINITMTQDESLMTEDAFITIDIFNEEFWDYMLTPEIFKDSIIDLLRTIEYNQMFKLYTDAQADDYSTPALLIDELNLFVRNFKDTLIFK